MQVDAFGAVDKRRRNLQVVLFLIILATLPFYCAGFALLGLPNANARQTPTSRPTTPAPLTRTIATQTRVAFPTLTSIGGGLQPTPPQFIPPVATIIFPTSVFPSPASPTSTFFVFPTSTPAPTLTPYPTLTPAATDTPLPFPTDPPLQTPTPTNTLAIPDTDGDGFADNIDLCPTIPGIAPNGCPPPGSETVIPPGS
jgi:hypothetical protein